MIEIIPAIDIIDGKCVRLVEGDFARSTIYDFSPVEAARRFEAAGLKRIHIVDLDGARLGRTVNLNILETVAKETDLVIDFGGGIGTEIDPASVFNAGAAMASIGSIAVRSPEMFGDWISTYGADRFLLGADVRGKHLAINGWQQDTEVEITSFLSNYLNRGIRDVFVTDIAKDGLLRGPSIELYRDLLEALPDLNLIASGGVSSLEDVRELEEIGCSGVIIGKAIYEGLITLGDLAEYAKGEQIC